ncbi:SNAP receptor [Aureococcus anophagefferens]|nr:SNAP receptor [Aureococcus anophagefferens]
MRNRLGDLRKVGGGGAGDVELGHVAVDIPPETGLKAAKSPGGGGGSFMATFFGQVDDVKEGINGIKAATKRIHAITDERMLAVSNATEEQLSRELTPLVDKTNRRVKATKELLQRMSDETASAKGTVKQSEFRIRENLANTLMRKFGDVCKDYQREQQRYKSEIQKTVKRQLEIVKPDVTPDEIDTVLRNGGTSEVFRSAILKGAADPIKSAYADVADKYQDVLKLEQSQGELLDQIEYQVKSAGEYIEDGNTDIQYAIQYQKEIRKRYCCLIVIILVIVLVLLVAIGAFNTGGDK